MGKGKKRVNGPDHLWKWIVGGLVLALGIMILREADLIREDIRAVNDSVREVRQNYSTLRHLYIEAHPKIARALLAVAVAESPDDPLTVEQQQTAFFILSGPAFEYQPELQYGGVFQALGAIDSLSDPQRQSISMSYLDAGIPSPDGQYTPKQYAQMFLAFDDVVGLKISRAARRVRVPLNFLDRITPPTWVQFLFIAALIGAVILLSVSDQTDE